MDKSVHYPTIPLTRGDDIHNLELMDSADLVLFLAGNQFMAAAKLLREFRKIVPSIHDIYYETLPPGLELKQILAGGAMFGETRLTGRPDVYTSVTEDAMESLISVGRVKEYSRYLGNRLVLMVAGGNPKGISSLADLGREDIIVSQPGELEDIRHYTRQMYTDFGGGELANRIMESKWAEGTTLTTLVHHRETPMSITRGMADTGPVWFTEVLNAKREGLEVEEVEVGPAFDQRNAVNYYCAVLNDAPNPENAELFVQYLKSSTAQEVFRGYGFLTD
jgi:ABC-type molybdate transport system substrate-binding protein